MNRPFTAALLAGGKSSRMGRDKACLEWEGEPLWRRQIRLLETLHPTQLLLSGRPDGPYMGSGYTIVLDSEKERGPLAGLSALLAACTTPRLLLLAVDMPWMTGEILGQLLSLPECAVPEYDGWWEGTAAVYPTGLLPLVEATLKSSDHSFQALIQKAVNQGLMKPFPVPKGLEKAFQSWNTPQSAE